MTLPNVRQVNERDHRLRPDLDGGVFKMHKAPEPDKIIPRILHDFANILSEPLADIFNKSLKTSTVGLPRDWQLDGKCCTNI